MSNFNCLELFSGAGGLAKGISLAGFSHRALVEFNKDAYQTLVSNYDAQLVKYVDVRDLNLAKIGSVDLVAGGPPCQPFSMGGKHKGNLDHRDMFPYACKAISSCVPKVFIFENVKGLLRKSFSKYFEYIILRLTYPNILSQDFDDWIDHLKILEEVHTSGIYNDLKYNVVFQLIDAANYGIPQRRERVFIVGIRDDLNVRWSFPKETHCLDSLLWSQFVSSEYWETHGIEPVDVESLEIRIQRKVLKLQQNSSDFKTSFKPWRTIRDQIGMLPQPDHEGSFNDEHVLREGARTYPGHTGSFIDMPSKTLKAGDHGVPGGENMIRYRTGHVRYFTTFEAKRLQTFPEKYKILGSWTGTMKQIGNAVPVDLAYVIANSILCSISNCSGQLTF